MDIYELFSQLKNFSSISRFIKKHTSYEIVKIVSNIVGEDPNVYAFYDMGGCRYVKNNDDTFLKGNGGYFFVLEDIKQNMKEYKNFYSLLSDDVSRQIFMKQMQYRIVPHPSLILTAYTLSKKFPQYFDEDIFSFGKDEVFVDCGGYIGDTTEEFVKLVGQYRRIYIYEPNPILFEKCKSKFLLEEKIVLRKAGVGSKVTKVSYRDTANDGSGSFALLCNDRNSQDNEDGFLDIVTLDEDILEPVTFIKMDVECFESKALRGAANHIKKYTPKLVICLYHLVSDIWEIPKLINEINPNYKYYLRHYHPQQNWEYVLYCVPRGGASQCSQ